MHLAAEVDVGGLGEKAESHFAILAWHLACPKLVAPNYAAICPAQRPHVLVNPAGFVNQSGFFAAAED
jgi:hypothetical protein